MRLFLLLIWPSIFFVNKSFAQSITLPNCGISVQDQVLLKERARTQIRAKDSLTLQFHKYNTLKSNPDSTYYVPVQVNICGEDNETGYITISRVLASICKLNSDFDSQNIQFYIFGINYISNSLLYNHGSNAGNPTALYLMSLYKVNGVMNIFIGREVNATDQFLAYYTNFTDVIYSFKTGIGNNNPTLTHEVGHFFSLPHTFFGWEGTNYNAEVVNNHAPINVGGHPVEKVIRGGAGENCQLAGDGFCDTPPDYSSERTICNHNLEWFDPDSVLTNPDVQNFMSYFDDNCLSNFSPEQKDAVLVDFISRGYYQFPRPSPLYVDASPNIYWPRTGAVAHYNTNIPFRWSKVDSASQYLVKIYRSYNNGSILLFLENETLTEDTTLTLALAPNFEYTWNVEALSSYDLCSDSLSTNETFTTADWILSNQGIEQETSEVKIYPNPIRTPQRILHLDIKMNKEASARISIINNLGQVVNSNTTILLTKGINNNQINTSQLQNGFYLIEIDLGQQQVYKKLIISK